jgi:hypothetical protein
MMETRGNAIKTWDREGSGEEGEMGRGKGGREGVIGLLGRGGRICLLLFD